MRILIVASANNRKEGATPFIREQAESLKQLSHDVEFFLIVGKGWLSYLLHIMKLRKYLKNNTFDFIHAHFVWCGVVAICQRRIPVITTFHGCDLNRIDLRRISRFIVYPFSTKCIVVNKNMMKFLPAKKTVWIPCGIDIDIFTPITKKKAREMLGWDDQSKYILFSSKFSRPEKNVDLANSAIELAKKSNTFGVSLIEFKGFSREQTILLYSASDLLLLTSLREGSPQVIKEAMACNCPIVSTDVGDVSWIVGDTANCYITGFNPEEICNKIVTVLSGKGRSNGRERMQTLNLSIGSIASRLDDLYKECLI